ncbi:TonB-dependent receptor [Shewanella sp. Choline-02u-19]|uniref:TonB-dependent receptor plug domain-containing protein n=1 Tax=unclassified Shewanella TaxID=196818 RepID=UPI000C347898|nr:MULTISPECIES: TonB-dependent receptor [unclassified Shewanella]PKH57630.1 TonB-dependent receptor [Shewanella sp. Bg11-22]PKI28492.1 TonB-dependent receptor [Shewanella sp. Choline-02u-19]
MKRTILSMAIALATVAPTTALAADITPEQNAKQPIEKIQVTGSRIKRTDFEGVAPVTVITAEEIANSGLSSIAEVLQSSIASSGGSLNGESDGFTDSASSVNLRGMGANRTLVLINGRRQASFPSAAGGTSNFVDVSDIPTAAVERIEILTGGASAIYGSDAVGGVVNIILKTEYEGSKIAVKYNDPTQGGGEQLDLSYLQGFNTEKSQTLLMIEYKNVQQIQTDQRDLFYSPAYYEDEDGDKRWGAGPYGDASASSWASWVRDYDSVYTDDKYSPVDEAQCENLFGDKGVYTPVGKYDCYYDKYADRGLQSAYDRINLVLSSTYDLNDDWQIYGMVNASYKESTKYKDEKGFGAYIYEDDATGALSYEKTDFDDYNKFQMRRRMEEFSGPRTYDTQNTKAALSFGVDGNIGEYELDVSWSSSYNKYEKQNHHMVKADALLDMLTFDPNDTDAAKWYPNNKLSTEQVNALIGDSTKESDSSMHQFQAVFTGDLMELSAGTVGFATTAEWARESYEDTLDAVTTSGGYIGMGGTGGKGDRDRVAVAGELQIPLISNITAVKSLELSAALRYDQYLDDSDVGGATTPQIGLMYRPIDEVLVRANWGKSFRAPDMHRLYAGITRSFGSTEYPHPTIPDEVYDDQYNSISSGNINLTEEKGDFWNLGLVANITDNADLTLDWWNIKLEGAVKTISTDEMLDDAAQYDQTGNYTSCDQMNVVGYLNELDDDGIENLDCMRKGPINSAYEASEGIDASFNYQFPETAAGEFKLKLAASYLIKKEYQETVESEIEEQTETDYFPKWKGQASVNWKMEDFSATLAYYYTGEAKGQDTFTLIDADGDEYEEEDYTDVLGAYQTLNLTLSYSAPWDGKFTAGVKNLTDEMPPLYDERNDEHDSWPFYEEDNSSYSAVGRSVFFGYSQKF